MKRNLQKQKELGLKYVRRNDRIDLGYEELEQIINEFKQKKSSDALWDTIRDAFYIGVNVGANCEKRKATRA